MNLGLIIGLVLIVFFSLFCVVMAKSINKHYKDAYNKKYNRWRVKGE